MGINMLVFGFEGQGEVELAVWTGVIQGARLKCAVAGE